MLKNYHFKKLLEHVRKNLMDSSSFVIVAQSSDGNNSLFIDFNNEKVFLCLRRDSSNSNMTAEIIQTFSSPAAFDLEFISVNNKEPYLSISLGNYNTILYLI